MTTTTEPRITFNKKARSIKADFLLATTNDGRDGEERRQYATFTVRYDIGGMNYFNGKTTPRSYSSGIARETEETLFDSDGNPFGTSRSFMLFKGLGLMRSAPVARYSEKALKAFFDEALAYLDEIRDDPQVARYFDTETPS
jgi:hypothetical protein